MQCNWMIPFFVLIAGSAFADDRAERPFRFDALEYAGPGDHLAGAATALRLRIPQGSPVLAALSVLKAAGARCDRPKKTTTVIVCLWYVPTSLEDQVDEISWETDLVLSDQKVIDIRVSRQDLPTEGPSFIRLSGSRGVADRKDSFPLPG